MKIRDKYEGMASDPLNYPEISKTLTPTEKTILSETPNSPNAQKVMRNKVYPAVNNMYSRAIKQTAEGARISAGEEVSPLFQ